MKPMPAQKPKKKTWKPLILDKVSIFIIKKSNTFLK